MKYKTMVIDDRKYYERERVYIRIECYSFDDIVIDDVIDDPKRGWIKPQIIGQPIKSNYPKVRYNQRRNLNSTTIKR